MINRDVIFGKSFEWSINVVKQQISADFDEENEYEKHLLEKKLTTINSSSNTRKVAMSACLKKICISD